MKLKKSPGWIIPGVVFLALGCASAPAGNVILQDNYNSVRLETLRPPDDGSQPMRFDHPVEIGVGEMERLLASVQVVIPPGFISRVLFKNKPVPEQAFTEQETQKFAPIFVEAFTKAGPEERVVFFLHHQRVVYKGTVSSGVAFFKDGHFNLILGRYLRGNQPGKPDIDVRGNPFTNTNEQTFYLNAGDFQNLITENRFPVTGEILFPRRWLAIDHAALLSSPAPKVREVSLEEMSSAPAGTAEPPGPAAEPGPSLEEKLRTLKRLYEEGLITEEEYNQKRDELIRSF